MTKATAKKVGRPTDYTAEVAAAICVGIALGDGLKTVCAAPGLPDPATVYRWLAGNTEFRELYAQARAWQGETLADEALEIADDGSADYKLGGRDGAEIVIDHEHISRSKLRVEQRRWHAAKLAPKKFGDRVAVEASGPDGKPIELAAMTDRMAKLPRALRDQMKALMQEAQKAVKA
ncbi:MAG: terminase small subunit [Caulobacter sp.]|nr:terminase small subunit [Caulobacter sp.]